MEVWTSKALEQETGTMMIKIRKMLKDIKGATAIEYGLIAALIAVAAIAAMSSLGTQLNNTLTKVRTEMAKTGA